MVVIQICDVFMQCKIEWQNIILESEKQFETLEEPELSPNREKLVSKKPYIEVKNLLAKSLSSKYQPP